MADVITVAQTIMERATVEDVGWRAGGYRATVEDERIDGRVTVECPWGADNAVELLADIVISRLRDTV